MCDCDLCTGRRFSTYPISQYDEQMFNISQGFRRSSRRNRFLEEIDRINRRDIEEAVARGKISVNTARERLGLPPYKPGVINLDEIRMDITIDTDEWFKNEVKLMGSTPVKIAVDPDTRYIRREMMNKVVHRPHEARSIQVLKTNLRKVCQDIGATSYVVYHDKFGAIERVSFKNGQYEMISAEITQWIVYDEFENVNLAHELCVYNDENYHKLYAPDENKKIPVLRSEDA